MARNSNVYEINKILNRRITSILSRNTRNLLKFFVSKAYKT